MNEERELIELIESNGKFMHGIYKDIKGKETENHYDIVPEKLALAISQKYVRKDRVEQCKYAIISHGIGLSNKAEEITVHCRMDSSNDYTATSPEVIKERDK